VHELAGLNSGDDDMDDDALVDELPSRHEVLKATSLINQYINSVDDPVARKLEAILHSFEWQLRLDIQQDMELTSITDYFKHVEHRTNIDRLK
jgi:hypothetical protein